jgi:hypothetical protein
VTHIAVSIKESQDHSRKDEEVCQPQMKGHPRVQVGDLVMLDGRNIQTRRPKDKLDYKKHGPFTIEKVVSPTAM